MLIKEIMDSYHYGIPSSRNYPSSVNPKILYNSMFNHIRYSEIDFWEDICNRITIAPRIIPKRIFFFFPSLSWYLTIGFTIFISFSKFLQFQLLSIVLVMPKKLNCFNLVLVTHIAQSVCFSSISSHMCLICAIWFNIFTGLTPRPPDSFCWHATSHATSPPLLDPLAPCHKKFPHFFSTSQMTTLGNIKTEHQ